MQVLDIAQMKILKGKRNIKIQQFEGSVQVETGTDN